MSLKNEIITLINVLSSRPWYAASVVRHYMKLLLFRTREKMLNLQNVRKLVRIKLCII